MNTFDKFQSNMSFVELKIDYLYYVYSLLCLIILVMVIFFLIKKLKKKEELSVSKEEELITKLKSLDFDTYKTRKVLYDFTLLAKQCKSEDMNFRLESILLKIEPLKYQKKDIPLPQDLKILLKEYIDDLAA